MEENNNLLTEFQDFSYEVLTEERPNGGPKKTMLKGLFQHGDIRNGNGRIYPRPILEREINKNIEKVKTRNMLGELDHPTEGKIHLDKVSHVITELNVQTDGRVIGSLEVFDGPDELGGTPKGRILGSLIRRNIKLGISSRGFGTTKENGDVNEVQDDFRLITFDIVADPSTPGAYPSAVYEEKNIQGWMSEPLPPPPTKAFSDVLKESLVLDN